MMRTLVVVVILATVSRAAADEAGTAPSKRWHDGCAWRPFLEADTRKLTSTRWCFGVPFSTLKSGYQSELLFEPDGRFSRRSNLSLKTEGDGRWEVERGIIQLSFRGKRIKSRFCAADFPKVSNVFGRPFDAILVDGSPYIGCGARGDGGP